MALVGYVLPLKMHVMKTKLLLSALLVTFFSVAAIAKPKAKTVELTAAQQARIQQIDIRVHEIKAMDKSALSSQERKALRKEVLQLKKEMGGLAGGGVYLSVAAIIIILLVLILIL